MSKRQRGAEVSNQADVARRGLVSVNRLDYTLQPDLSVAVARSSKKHFFQHNSYTPGQRAICIFNSGAEYVDPQNSYVKFSVQVPFLGTADANPSFLGAGSACNFISQIILTSRSGDEIERIDNVNHLAPMLDRMMNSSDWIRTHGELIGYSNQDEKTTDGARDLTEALDSPNFYKKTGKQVAWVAKQGRALNRGTSANVKNFFIIPLSCISGLFRSFDRLLPSMLMSGFRLELQFASGNEALKTLGEESNSNQFTIDDLEVVLDQYQLTDSIMRVLNEEAALRGLEVVFSTWYNHVEAQKASEFNVQIRKAVSRALGILMKIAENAAEKDTDSFVGKIANFTAYQVRVGSLYFPQQGIKSSAANEAQAELYHHTLRSIGKWKTPNAPSSLSLHDYVGSGADNSLQMIYTDLERSNTQKLTGIPVNNSRVAEVMGTKALEQGDRVMCFLHYVRLLRVFLQNVEVEE